ncbi:MAG TPA: heme-binding protein [Chloroflexota bacterium]|jgi:uncharacterized protein GlcG (DUF336 family)
MLTLTTLGLEEAQRAVAAVLDAAARAGRTMAVAVVDHDGELIACARMNGAPARYQRAAIRKAYTAAVFGRNTTGLKQWWQEKESGQTDWNDSMLTTLSGGLVAVCGDEVVGAIGVSGGNNVTTDVEIANVGLRAMGDDVRHREGWT